MSTTENTNAFLGRFCLWQEAFKRSRNDSCSTSQVKNEDPDLAEGWRGFMDPAVDTLIEKACLPALLALSPFSVFSAKTVLYADLLILAAFVAVYSLLARWLLRKQEA
jgi:hypothetical protein